MIARVLVLPIRFYQRYISRYTPPSCTFTPTCSAYTVTAIERHGLWGVWLGAWRICRCNPYTGGGEDPVPD
jgi:putative membrane protein insertion efficiency factor